jgi:uncharacterized surface protein with fasciclin (FAS1) repeats
VVIVVQSVPAICCGDNIYDIANGADDFSSLVQAVNAADLDDTLSSPGTYTIFAPTNEAFQKLPSSTLKKLLNPIYKPQLTDLLLYHALGDEVVFSSDLSDGMEATTLILLLLSIHHGSIKSQRSFLRTVYMTSKPPTE